jgi:hypothetical protein
MVDTFQERSNSDFDIKCATIQFYGNSHNSQSNRWIELTFYEEPTHMLSYLGLKFEVIGVWKGIETQVNRGYMNFVIYFLFTRVLSIWLGFFS